MTDDSTPNSFFSMVTGKKDAADLAAGEQPKQHVLSSQGAKGEVGSQEQPASADASQSDAAMPHDARRALVHLMRQGAVMAAQKPKVFELICRYQTAIRKHLAEVYLRLMLDEKTGVAFVASADYEAEHGNDAEKQNDDISFEEDELALGESTSLISKRTLSLYDTLILLVLRKHYQDRESAGEQKITIDVERLESYLAPFLPITDHGSKDRKKLLARVKEMVKRKVLANIRGADDRYEITPVIRYVVSASFLETMLGEYQALAQSQLDDKKPENEA